MHDTKAHIENVYAKTDVDSLLYSKQNTPPGDTRFTTLVDLSYYKTSDNIDSNFISNPAEFTTLSSFIQSEAPPPYLSH